MALPPDSPMPSIGTADLLALVLEAVSAVDRHRLNAARRPSDPVRVEVMLGLLSYCYVSGIHASEAVEAATYTNPTIAYLCMNAHPGAREIQRFRRHHRALIEAVLVQIVGRVRRTGLPLAEVPTMAWPGARAVAANGVRRAPALAQRPAEIVERWLNQAVLLDSVARDT